METNETVPKYVQWLTERPLDMLNTGLMVMTLEQAIMFWRMGWPRDSEGRSDDLFGNVVLFVRSLEVRDKAFRGFRMTAETAETLATKYKRQCVLAKERGSFLSWNVEVKNNEVVGITKKQRATLQMSNPRHIGYKTVRHGLGLDIGDDSDKTQGWMCHEYIMDFGRATVHDEDKIAQLARGWMPYSHCIMEVAVLEGQHKIVDFDEIAPQGNVFAPIA